MSVIKKIAEAFMRMWKIRDELRFRNIRMSHLQYTLAMPMCLGIGNMMSSLFRSNAWLLGLDPKVTLYCAYLLGALLFCAVPAKRFFLFMRMAAVLSGSAFLVWLVLPHGKPQAIAATICWFALGACVFCTFCVYMLVINNIERLFGAVLIAVNYGICLLLDATEVTNGVLWKALPLGFLTGAIVCISFFKRVDLAVKIHNTIRKMDRRMYPALALFLVFFLMDAFISFLYIRGGQATILRFGLGATLGGIIMVMVQLVFKRSIWHIWNLYFILLVASFALMQTRPDSATYLTGSFICGLCTCGYAAAFYTYGGVMKKFGDYAVFKKTFCLISLPPLIISFTVMGILQAYLPEYIPLISFVTAIVIFVIYVMLSPVFQKHLFTSDWIDDYHKADMTAIEAKVEKIDALSKLGLTPREREICALLLAGYSRKQIGAELKISYPTVGFHCTALYKKLNINSLSELFAMFGYNEAAAAKETREILGAYSDK